MHLPGAAELHLVSLSTSKKRVSVLDEFLEYRTTFPNFSIKKCIVSRSGNSFPARFEHHSGTPSTGVGGSLPRKTFIPLFGCTKPVNYDIYDRNISQQVVFDQNITTFDDLGS